jgi:hypothetical protein
MKINLSKTLIMPGMNLFKILKILNTPQNNKKLSKISSKYSSPISEVLNLKPLKWLP